MSVWMLDDNGKATHKKCSVCGEMKEVSKFYKESKKKHGIKVRCKVCSNNSEKEYNKTDKGRIKDILWGMKKRCYNKKCKSYDNYGSRGIVICDKWNCDSDSFVKWSLSNGYKKDLTIERINTNGNYEPSNCTWITKSEQGRNTTKTKLTMELANSIRTRILSGVVGNDLDREFGLSLDVSRSLLNPNTTGYYSWRTKEWLECNPIPEKLKKKKKK